MDRPRRKSIRTIKDVGVHLQNFVSAIYAKTQKYCGILIFVQSGPANGRPRPTHLTPQIYQTNHMLRFTGDDVVATSGRRCKKRTVTLRELRSETKCPVWCSTCDVRTSRDVHAHAFRLTNEETVLAQRRFCVHPSPTTRQGRPGGQVDAAAGRDGRRINVSCPGGEQTGRCQAAHRGSVSLADDA